MDLEKKNVTPKDAYEAYREGDMTHGKPYFVHFDLGRYLVITDDAGDTVHVEKRRFKAYGE